MAVTTGWFQYKLARSLTEAEAADLSLLAGPLYQPWANSIMAHENCAWLAERWLTQQGVVSRLIHPPLALPALTSLPPLEGLREWVPDFLTAYQREGILAFGNRTGVFAVWPTGSGKSLLGIIYGLLRPGLVVFITRASARGTIVSEIERYTTFTPFVLRGEREMKIPEGTRFVVVGWESLAHHVQDIINAAPVTMIADESHMCKGWKRYEAIVARSEGDTVKVEADGSIVEKIEFRKLNNRFASAETISRAVKYRMNLTATPIRDRIRDLWAQLDLIMPRAWGGFYKWCERYADAHPSQWGGIDTRGRSDAARISELTARMSFSTFYLAQSVTHRDLPAKRRQVTYIKSEELSTGRDVLRELREHAFSSASGEAWAKLALAAAMKRKRIVEEAALGAYTAPDGKSGGKVVVLTGLRVDAERIADLLRKRATWGVGKNTVLPQVWTAHGGSSPTARDVMRDEYMAHPGPCVLVGTIDALGESINLQDTDLGIIAMLPVTPGQIRQAEGRFSRRGQKRPVLIVYYVAEGTYDEHVAQSLLTKLPAVEKVAKDEVLIDFGTDLRGDEEAIAAGLFAKLTASEVTEAEDSS